MLQTKVVEEI